MRTTAREILHSMPLTMEELLLRRLCCRRHTALVRLRCITRLSVSQLAVRLAVADDEYRAILQNSLSYCVSDSC
jgi:hypothetical protein